MAAGSFPSGPKKIHEQAVRSVGPRQNPRSHPGPGHRTAMGAAANTARSIDPSPTIATLKPAHQHRERDHVQTPDEAHNAVFLLWGTVSETAVPRQTDRRGAASGNAGRPGRINPDDKGRRESRNRGSVTEHSEASARVPRGHTGEELGVMRRFGGDWEIPR